MKCPQCGAEIAAKPGEKHPTCDYCGVSVSTVAEQARRSVQASAERFDKIFEDADDNGLPDIFEGAAAKSASVTKTSTTYRVGGKTYGSIDEMPAEVRRVFEASDNLFGALNVFSAPAAAGADPGAVDKAVAPRVGSREPAGSGSRAPKSGLRVVGIVVAIVILVALGIALGVGLGR